MYPLSVIYEQLVQRLSKVWQPKYGCHGSLDDLSSEVWRAHDGRYDAASYGGALRFSARFHRAPDSFPLDQTFPALYLALAPEVALGEVPR